MTWDLVAVPRSHVGASIVAVRPGEWQRVGVAERAATQPPVRRTGGGPDPRRERARPGEHRLHPDAQQLLALQAEWQGEGWARQHSQAASAAWAPPGRR